MIQGIRFISQFSQCKSPNVVKKLWYQSIIQFLIPKQRNKTYSAVDENNFNTYVLYHGHVLWEQFYCCCMYSKTVGNIFLEKLLNVKIDSDLNFEEHISSICKKASAKLNALARISPYIDEGKRWLIMNACSIPSLTTALLHECSTIVN